MPELSSLILVYNSWFTQVMEVWVDNNIDPRPVLPVIVQIVFGPVIVFVLHSDSLTI